MATANILTVPNGTELKALLAQAPDKTISLRKEGLQLGNIKTLVAVNAHLLSIGGKGAWPTAK